MTQTSKTEDDTIDLKELFFSLIAQWKIIALCIILSLICALLYIRTTPSIYSTDALVQVEDGKSAASAALLGELKEVSGGLGQKSPADAEIEILNSRMVLGKVIDDLNLNISIQDQNNSFFKKLLSSEKGQLKFDGQGVSYSTKQNNFLVKEFSVPNYYLDKKLTLDFKADSKFTLSHKDKVIFEGRLNQFHLLALEI